MIFNGNTKNSIITDKDKWIAFDEFFFYISSSHHDFMLYLKTVRHLISKVLLNNKVCGMECKEDCYHFIIMEITPFFQIIWALKIEIFNSNIPDVSWSFRLENETCQYFDNLSMVPCEDIFDLIWISL